MFRTIRSRYKITYDINFDVFRTFRRSQYNSVKHEPRPTHSWTLDSLEPNASKIKYFHPFYTMFWLCALLTKESYEHIAIQEFGNLICRSNGFLTVTWLPSTKWKSVPVFLSVRYEPKTLKSIEWCDPISEALDKMYKADPDYGFQQISVSS